MMTNPFDEIQQKANISPEEIYKIAESVKHADLTDEMTLRQLIRQLATLANRPISETKEDQLIQAIKENNIPLNIQSINKFL